MPLPTAAPNYDSTTPNSAWWLETLPDGSRRVYSTTGYGFVRTMQEALRSFEQTVPTVISVFDGGRSDVSAESFADHAALLTGDWIARDTALLWHWLSKKRDAETNPTTQHAIQHAMDEVERIIAEHPLPSMAALLAAGEPNASVWDTDAVAPITGAFVPLEALRAAIWLTQYPDQNYQYVIDHVVVDGGPQFAGQVVTPPYGRASLQPGLPDSWRITVSNPDTRVAAPASAPSGMSGGAKVLIGIGIVAAVGTGWYYWRRSAQHAG